MSALNAETLIQKLAHNPDEAVFFDRELPQLLEEDPRAALRVLEHAEKSSLSLPRVLTARILALIALREAKAAFDAYRGYLEACRAAGGFNLEPPLDALELFFEQVNERAWATEVREVAAMECNEIFNRILGTEVPHEELHSVSITLDVQLESASETGAEVARACALKACVLTKLGQKTEALKFWKKAKAAAPDVAEFWSTNSLLA
ncbi:MAG: hypothetical protein IPJ65_00440 [Archangiaceae bacterium]|nr:hypothetical protein [Archangiaceae bacterium]